MSHPSDEKNKGCQTILHSRLAFVINMLYKSRFLLNHCCPSGFNELRPARRISSVDKRLTAMTELINAAVSSADMKDTRLEAYHE